MVPGVIAPATGQFGDAAVQIALAMGAGTMIAMGRNTHALQRVESLDRTRIKRLQLMGDWKKELEELQAFEPIEAFFDISPMIAKHYKPCISALRRNGRAGLMVGMFFGVWQSAVKRKVDVGSELYRRPHETGDSGLLKLGPRGGIEIMGNFGLEQWNEAVDMRTEKARLDQMTLMMP